MKTNVRRNSSNDISIEFKNRQFDDYVVLLTQQEAQDLAVALNIELSRYLTQFNNSQGPIDMDKVRNFLRDESVPTNEIHVFGADGKRVIVKF